MKTGIKDTFDSINNSPEYNRILGAAGEQGRIIGILEYYEEKYPEFAEIFNQIMEEIEISKNND